MVPPRFPVGLKPARAPRDQRGTRITSEARCFRLSGFPKLAKSIALSSFGNGWIKYRLEQEGTQRSELHRWYCTTDWSRTRPSGPRRMYALVRFLAIE